MTYLSVFVSPAKHSNTLGSLCPLSVRPSIRLSVRPSVTLRLSHFPKLCFAGDTCIPRNAATIFLCLNNLGICFVILRKPYSFCLTISYYRVHVVVCALTGPDRCCLFHRFCVWSPDWSRFLRICQTTPGGFLYRAGTLRLVVGCYRRHLYLSILQGNFTTRKESKFQIDCDL